MPNESLPYTPLYINGASQVRYYDPETSQYYGGIVFGDQLISGKTGEHWSTDQYVTWASVLSGLEADDIIVTRTWTDISEAIASTETTPWWRFKHYPTKGIKR